MSSLCLFCGLEFEEKRLLKKHIFNVHDRYVRHKCNKCGKVCDTSARLKRHVLYHCEKSASRPPDKRGNLKVSLLTTKGECLYHCQVCNLVFRDPSNLKEHWLTHETELPNQCVVCHRVFKKRSELIRHFLTHTGERLYQCTECESSFSAKQPLRTHMFLHTGHRFQCPVCKRYFSQKTSLKRHVSRVHEISTRHEDMTPVVVPDLQDTIVQEDQVCAETGVMTEEITEEMVFQDEEIVEEIVVQAEEIPEQIVVEVEECQGSQGAEMFVVRAVKDNTETSMYSSSGFLKEEEVEFEDVYSTEERQTPPACSSPQATSSLASSERHEGPEIREAAPNASRAITQELEKAKKQVQTAINVIEDKQTSLYNIVPAQDDECELFGKMLAKKLRKLPFDERRHVMHEIDSLILTRRQNPESSLFKVSTTV